MSDTCMPTSLRHMYEAQPSRKKSHTCMERQVAKCLIHVWNNDTWCSWIFMCIWWRFNMTDSGYTANECPTVGLNDGLFRIVWPVSCHLAERKVAECWLAECKLAECHLVEYKLAELYSYKHMMSHSVTLHSTPSSQSARLHSARWHSAFTFGEWR